MYIINFRMTGEKNRKESKVRNVTDHNFVGFK